MTTNGPMILLSLDDPVEGMVAAHVDTYNGEHTIMLQEEQAEAAVQLVGGPVRWEQEPGSRGLNYILPLEDEPPPEEE